MSSSSTVATVVISFALWVLLLFSGPNQALADNHRDLEDLRPVRYDNHSLYRVWSTVSSGAPIIEDGFHGALVLSTPDARTASYDVIVPPEKNNEFLEDLKVFRFNYELIDANVQAAIDEEKQRNKMNTRLGDTYGWDRYQSYDETNTWMKQMEEQHPGVVTRFNIGKSYQNRDTYGLRLSRGGGSAKKPAVFIESGVHSREWVAPATSTWIFNHLATSEDPKVRQLSTDYDWYVVPVVNPDGYVHTHQANRMWRKSMRRSLLCMGTDINRNWNYHWREAGSSSYACSDLYAGSSAMSEPETRNLDNFMKKIKDNVKLYISFHAYSQLLLWPEGHTSQRIEEYDDYERIGKATVEAIAQRYGTEYERGSIIEAIYPASGSTIDYMRATYKIPLTFCFELRPSRSEGGGKGFMLEPSQITPTAEETFDGIAAMIGEGHKLGYM